LILDHSSVVHTERASYLVVGIVQTEHGTVYIGARCGRGLAFAVLMRTGKGWHVAPLDRGVSLVGSLALTLRADPRRRLLAWDPDFVPISHHSDLVPGHGPHGY